MTWIPDLADTAVVVGPLGSDISDDGGTNWSPINVNAPHHPFLMGVACQSQNACWAVGANAGQGSITPGAGAIAAKLMITV